MRADVGNEVSPSVKRSCAAVAVWCVLSLSTAFAADEVLKVGELGSLTGTDTAFGTDVHDGLVMAVAEANAAGGVKLAAGGQRRIQLESEDDHSRRDHVDAAVRKLVETAQVQMVIGGTSSSLSLSGAAVCQKAGVPMLCPAATAPAVTRTGDRIFRACFIDPQQGFAMAAFARNNLKAKTAGVLLEGASDYSRTLGHSFAAAFVWKGGGLAPLESYSRKDNDFKAQLTNLRQANVDVLYVPGLCTQVAQIANQARDIGFQAILLGGDGWDAPRFRELGGAAVIGAFFTNHYSPLTKKPEVETFVAAFQKRYNRAPTGPAALGYDAGRLALDAISRAKEPTRDGITAALRETRNFPAVTGSISLDAHRNATKPVVVVEVTSDGYEPREVVTP